MRHSMHCATPTLDLLMLNRVAVGLDLHTTLEIDGKINMVVSEVPLEEVMERRVLVDLEAEIEEEIWERRIVALDSEEPGIDEHVTPCM